MVFSSALTRQKLFCSQLCKLPKIHQWEWSHWCGWLGSSCYQTTQTNSLRFTVRHLRTFNKPVQNIWRAPWKNRISSTTMKLRKSLVKPVMRQNISSCLVLAPEVIMHDAFNVILWTSADICVIVHDDLGWKNRTTRYNCRFSAASLALRVIFVRRKRPLIYA